MTQQVLSVQPIPAQTFQATLGNQNCQITLQWMATGLFISLSIDSIPIISGKYCNDRVNLIRRAYLGFVGWLYFVDTAPGSTGETQPLTGTPPISLWTIDSGVTTDSDDTIDNPPAGNLLTSVPLGLDPNFKGLGTRYQLIYES